MKCGENEFLRPVSLYVFRDRLSSKTHFQETHKSEFNVNTTIICWSVQQHNNITSLLTLYPHTHTILTFVIENLTFSCIVDVCLSLKLQSFPYDAPRIRILILLHD